MLQKIRQLIFYGFLFVVHFSFSQISISGTISSLDNVKISNASVLLLELETEKILTYTYTNDLGEFELEVEEQGKYVIRVTSFGFKRGLKEIVIKDESKNIIIDFFLEEEIFNLDEVVIKTKAPIVIKKDTIVINVKSFLIGTEEVVEDLLKNIPGVQVDPDGTIKVNNREVEKVMVEGDDFFEKGYKILTKSMPSESIQEVEILQNYSNNRLLKDIEQSNKVALNLKLTDEAKRKWFGNASLSHSLIEDRYDLQGNLMNFGKKNKYYILLDLNNSGFDLAGGDVSNLLKSFRASEAINSNETNEAVEFTNISSTAPNFYHQRINFNNAEVMSLTGIFNPTKKLKIKALSLAYFDENDFFNNQTTNYSFQDVSFINNEDYSLSSDFQKLFGKIDITYEISKNQSLKLETQYNNNGDTKNSEINFNGNSTEEELSMSDQVFNQRLNYTLKLSQKSAFIFKGNLMYQKKKQSYNLQPFYYEDLFPNSLITNSVVQENDNSMLTFDTEAKYFKRRDNGSLLEFSIGNSFRQDDIKSSFLLMENDEILDSPEEYMNDNRYRVNNLHFSSKYRAQIGEVALIGKVEIHYLKTKINQVEQLPLNQSVIYLNPTIGFDWKINDKNKITSAYSHSTQNTDVKSTFKNFVHSSFRTFTKGLDGFDQLSSSSFTLNYQLGNWLDKFFANTILVYIVNHDFLTTNTIINPNYLVLVNTPVKDRKLLSLNSSINRYFKVISSNLKIKIGYSKSDFKNIINDSSLRNIEAQNYNYGFELRSGLKGVFNYHFGSNWSQSNIQSGTKRSFTDNLSFIDLSYVISEKFNLQMASERYFFGNLDSNKSTYYFLDFEANYTLKKNKISFKIRGKNLFNTNVYRTYSIDDVSESIREYRLLPRFILFGVKYRF